MFSDENGTRIANAMGPYCLKTRDKIFTKSVELQPGEVIVGVSIEEVPFYKDVKHHWKAYEK